MVPRFAARHPDRHRRPGLGLRRHPGRTGAQLDDRPAFVALGVRRAGLVGMAWVVLWLVFGREGTLVDPPVGEHGATVERIPWRHLIFCPSIVAVCCAGFACYWGLALGLTWFTAYLSTGWATARRSAGDLSCCPGSSAWWWCWRRLDLPAPQIARRLEPAEPRRLRRRHGDPGRLPRAVRLRHADARAKLALLVAGTSIGATIFVVLPMIVCELTPQPQRAAMLAITNSAVVWPAFWRRWSWAGRVESPTSTLGYEEGFVVLGICWWRAASSACCSSGLKSIAGAGAARPSCSLGATGARLIAKMRRRRPCVPAIAPVSWSPSPIQRAIGSNAQ